VEKTNPLDLHATILFDERSKNSLNNKWEDVEKIDFTRTKRLQFIHKKPVYTLQYQEIGERYDSSGIILGKC